MRVMVIVKASSASEAGVMPSTAELDAMGKFNEELVNAGLMLAGEGLHPTAKGLRVRFSGGKSTLIPGPFDRPDDQIAGFWIWNVKSMDEAIDWAKRAPMQDAELELRPVFEAEDFGAEFTPELRAQEERLRTRVEQNTRPPQH